MGSLQLYIPTQKERMKWFSETCFWFQTMRHGERQVSDINMPGERKGISVIEIFAPLIEVSKEDIIEEKGVNSNKRPVVQFRIKVGINLCERYCH
jgi:hypothetical protein